VIDLVPAHEGEAAAKARADKRAWLIAHGYRVLTVEANAVEADLSEVLNRLMQELSSRQ